MGLDQEEERMPVERK